MQDYLTHLEKLRKDAAECRLISDLATDAAKRELFDRLATRIFFIISCSILGAIGSYYSQPYMTKNADAVLIIITVFTVFAGFLIAIITIIGDPIMIPEGSWRLAEGGREKMERRLVWHIILFILYLVTIGFLFTGAVLEKAIEDHHHFWKVWIERAYSRGSASSLTHITSASLN